MYESIPNELRTMEAGSKRMEPYKRGLLHRAAKAIEELRRRIKELELHYCPHAIHNEHDRGDDSLCEKYKCEVTAFPRWISVTERLPEDGSDVLAYLKYDEVAGRITAANYDKGMWQDCVMASLYRTEEGVVTHWMPLPEPPKEEKKND